MQQTGTNYVGIETRDDQPGNLRKQKSHQPSLFNPQEAFGGFNPRLKGGSLLVRWVVKRAWVDFFYLPHFKPHIFFLIRTHVPHAVGFSGFSAPRVFVFIQNAQPFTSTTPRAIRQKNHNLTRHFYIFFFLACVCSFHKRGPNGHQGALSLFERFYFLACQLMRFAGGKQ